MSISSLNRTNSTPRAEITAILTPATLTIAAAVALAACGSPAVQSASCGAEPRDSVFAAAGPVYHECAVSKRAKLTNPDVRPIVQLPQRSGCYSAELMFVVDANGRPETSTARVAMTNYQPLGDALLTSLDQWRYEPAQREGAPVRQVVIEKRSVLVSNILIPAGSAPPRTPPRMPGC